jgi:hypothetical protein
MRMTVTWLAVAFGRIAQEVVRHTEPSEGGFAPEPISEPSLAGAFLQFELLFCIWNLKFMEVLGCSVD